MPAQTPEPQKLPTLDDYGQGKAGDDFARRRRTMLTLVALVTLAGICAFSALMVYAVKRTVNQEHFQFRAFVRPGVTEDEIIQRFGRPYRIFYTRSSVEPIFAGRGQYRRFDRDVSPDQPGMSDFSKILHYRTTLEHGEFVFLDESGAVSVVVTARP